jgi:hypothetical protein
VVSIPTPSPKEPSGTDDATSCFLESLCGTPGSVDDPGQFGGRRIGVDAEVVSRFAGGAPRSSGASGSVELGADHRARWPLPGTQRREFLIAGPSITVVSELDNRYATGRTHAVSTTAVRMCDKRLELTTV